MFVVCVCVFVCDLCHFITLLVHCFHVSVEESSDTESQSCTIVVYMRETESLRCWTPETESLRETESLQERESVEKREGLIN